MNYEECTLAQLRQIAKEKGIKNVSKLKKDELCEVLKKSEIEDSNTTEEQPDTPIIEKVEDEPEDLDTRMEDGYTLTSNDMLVDGVLEILPDGYGFLRGENY